MLLEKKLSKHSLLNAKCDNITHNLKAGHEQFNWKGYWLNVASEN